MRVKIVLVALFMCALIGSLFTPLTPASAWSGTLPACGSFPSAWQSQIQADSRYNSRTAWVAFERTWSGAPYYGQKALVVDWDPVTVGNDHFIFSETSTNNVLYGPSHGVSAYQVTSTGLVSVSGNFGSMADLSCVLDVHNVNYVAEIGITPHEYPDSVAENQGNIEYVAMGDSYSSGEGAPAFLYGTDILNTNECRRSENSYAMLLDRDQSLNLDLTSFVACSGATTNTLLNGGQWSNEPAQIDSLSSSTEIVTITIGGNDVGFSEYATSCAASGFCDEESGAYEEIMDAINGDLNWKLETVYQEILDRAQNATVYVTGYPYLVDPLAGCVSFGWADDIGILNVIDHLNDTIEDSVNSVESSTTEPTNSGRIQCVEPNRAEGPFEDHYLCSSAPYFHGAIVSPDARYSFHPNQLGQEAYEALFTEAMN